MYPWIRGKFCSTRLPSYWRPPKYFLQGTCFQFCTTLNSNVQRHSGAHVSNLIKAFNLWNLISVQDMPFNKMAGLFRRYVENIRAPTRKQESLNNEYLLACEERPGKWRKSCFPFVNSFWVGCRILNWSSWSDIMPLHWKKEIWNYASNNNAQKAFSALLLELAEKVFLFIILTFHRGRFFEVSLPSPF